jgi:hypothetical protein
MSWEDDVREADGTLIKPWIRDLATRGNITVEEYKNIRCNSYEHELLVPALYGAHDHSEECFTNNEARAFAEVIDDIREALGQKETHYLVIADDVKYLVEAVERQGGSAAEALEKIRAEPGSGNPKQPVADRGCDQGHEDFERTPDGAINNCALANGDTEANCQICSGSCPDIKQNSGPDGGLMIRRLRSLR